MDMTFYLAPLDGLTNRQVADAASRLGHKLTARTVYNVRKGRSRPSYATMQALEAVKRDAPDKLTPPTGR